MVYVGFISCALYLWHYAVLMFLRALPVAESTVLLVGVPFSFVAASLTHHLIELPTLRWRNERTRSRLEPCKPETPATMVMMAKGVTRAGGPKPDLQLSTGPVQRTSSHAGWPSTLTPAGMVVLTVLFITMTRAGRLVTFWRTSQSRSR
jgi:hypothetical protein